MLISELIVSLALQHLRLSRRNGKLKTESGEVDANENAFDRQTPVVS